MGYVTHRPPGNSAYLKIIFLISQPKHAVGLINICCGYLKEPSQ